MLPIADLMRDLQERGLVKAKLTVKSFLRLTEEEAQQVKALARAMRSTESAARRAIFLRGLQATQK